MSDIGKADEFYQGKLRLPLVQSVASANIVEGGRVYGSHGAPALNVYESPTAGTAQSTMATWYVEDIDDTVDDLAAAGVAFERYVGLEHDARGITERAGGGRIAWFRDPDGNTFAIEADS